MSYQMGKTQLVDSPLWHGIKRSLGTIQLVASWNTESKAASLIYLVHWWRRLKSKYLFGHFHLTWLFQFLHLLAAAGELNFLYSSSGSKTGCSKRLEVEAGPRPRNWQSVTCAISIGQSIYESYSDSRAGNIVLTSQFVANLMKLDFCPVVNGRDWKIII